LSLETPKNPLACSPEQCIVQIHEHEETGMRVNKKQAAQMVGIGRTTFYKHIKSKAISVDSKGRIDVSELIRVYGNENIRTLEQASKEKSEHSSTQKSVRLNEDLAHLKSEMDTIKKERQREREQLEEQISNLRQTLDKAMSNNDNLTRLITDQRKTEEKSKVQKEQKQADKLDSLIKKIDQLEEDAKKKKNWWPFGNKNT